MFNQTGWEMVVLETLDTMDMLVGIVDVVTLELVGVVDAETLFF